MTWSSHRLRWLLAATVAVVSALIVFFGFARQSSSTAVALQPLAKACPEPGKHVFTCQEKYYQGIVERQDPKAAYVSLKREYRRVSSVHGNCHQLTHVIGRAAGHKYRDISEAYDHGDNFCWSGYYHGVMEAVVQRYGPKDVTKRLNDICAGIAAKARYSFDHYNCAHGLGHGVMLITNEELFKSLRTCDALRDGWDRESCYGGVFMENIMARLNPDHDTKYLRDDQPLYPCTAVADRYANQCYLMQTSRALDVLGGDFKRVFGVCATVKLPYRDTCWQSLGRDASGRSVSDVAKTKATCMLGSSEVARKNCLVGAVKDFIAFFHGDRQAVQLCDSFTGRLAAACHETRKTFTANLAGQRQQ
jgi:hypothetical protein